jgi:chromosome segregation ATPase
VPAECDVTTLKTAVGDRGLALYVMGRQDVFEQLKQEVERCHDLLRQLESNIDATNMAADAQQQLKQHVGGLWQSLQQQRQLLATFWLAPDTNTSSRTETSSLRTENETLRRQLSELRQRYTRAKQTIKSAQERIDTNSRKKQELLQSHHKRNDEAIIEQINKTRQVLAQTTHNLETVQHRQQQQQQPSLDD